MEIARDATQDEIKCTYRKLDNELSLFRAPKIGK